MSDMDEKGRILNGRVLKDNEGRVIDYLRISVTDRCNFRCFYCMPQERVHFFPSNDILRYEEILYLADIFIEMGIRKIRITGGEPLSRRNILFLFEELGKRERLSELTLTTNGTRLSEYAQDLKQAGVRRVNVSLDSLNRETYKRISGIDDFERVIQGIEASKDLGLKLKFNVVAMKGINSDEFSDFVKFGIEKEIDIRFIEVMPQVYNNRIAADLFVPSKVIKEEIEKVFRLEPLPASDPSSTAALYRIEGSVSTVGLISPLSHPFCSRCNKVRLMPNGCLKTCLFGKEGINLKTLLKKGMIKKELKKEIVKAVLKKPQKYYLDKGKVNLVMHRVGG